MGRHAVSERPSESSLPEDIVGRDETIAAVMLFLTQRGYTITAPGELDPPNKALRAVQKLYLRWEQEFTGVGKLHDVVQGHVTDLRWAFEENLGPDWY